MHPYEPFRGGAPHTHFNAPCTPVEECWSRGLHTKLLPRFTATQFVNGECYHSVKQQFDLKTHHYRNHCLIWQFFHFLFLDKNWASGEKD